MNNKNIGYALLGIGGMVLVWAFFIFDTTVAVDAYTRVNNLGLLNDQRNYSMLGGFVAVVGIFFLLRTESKDKQEKSSDLPITSPRIDNQGFNGSKSIDNDAYKIFLVKKYAIEKNVALDKFIVGEKLFNSIEEALIYASGMDESSTTSNSQDAFTKNIDSQKKINESDKVDGYAKPDLAKVSAQSETIIPKEEPNSASALKAKEDQEKKSESNLIRNRLIVGAVLLLVGGTYYINKSSEDPKITALIKKSNTAVFECIERNVKSSCNVANQTIKELKSKGYCHGRVNEPRSNYMWHKCDKTSL